MKMEDRRDIVSPHRDGWSESCGGWDRTDGKSGIPRARFGWGLLQTIWALLCRAAGSRMAWGNGPRSHWGHKQSGRMRRRVSAIYGRTA